MRKYRYTTLIIFSLLASFEAAHALSLDVRTSPQNRLDFAVNISNLETELANTTPTAYLRSRRIGVSSFDIPADGMQLGGYLGYAYASQNNISTVQGLELNGYFAGIGMRYPIAKFDIFQANIEGDYIYQSVNGASDGESANVFMHEYQLGLTASLAITRFMLTAGVFHRNIDLTYEISGTTPQTLDLKQKDDVRISAGIEYQVDYSGRVGLRFSSGSAEGIEFMFQRYF